MASESGEDIKEDISPMSDSAKEDTLDRLSKDFDDLSEHAQQLLTEKLFLENEFAQLKKRANRLDEELRNIKTPPLVVG